MCVSCVRGQHLFLHFVIDVC